MYALARSDLIITNLAMTNEDASFPASNLLTKYTLEVAKSTTNTTTITYDATDLSDIDIYNTNAITGNVTIKDAGTLAVLATETIDFTTATSVSYLTTDDITYHKNIRAFHGDQFYNDIKVEIVLTSDIGTILECGVIASGIFVRYGATGKATADKAGITYNVASLITEYQALLNKVNSKNEFFIHHYQTQVDGENMWMAYGIPELSSQQIAGNRHYKYSVKVKI